MYKRFTTPRLLASLLCVIFLIVGCGQELPASPPRPIEPTVPSLPTSASLVSPPSPTAVTILGFPEIIGKMTEERARAQNSVHSLQQDVSNGKVSDQQLTNAEDAYKAAQIAFNSWICKMKAELDSGNAKYFDTSDAGAQSVVIGDAQKAVNESEKFINTVYVIQHPPPTPAPGERGAQSNPFSPIDPVALVDTVLKHGIEIWKTLNELSAAQRAQMRADLGNQVWPDFDGSTVNPCS
jgi:hypothetical protein